MVFLSEPQTAKADKPGNRSKASCYNLSGAGHRMIPVERGLR